MTLSSDERGPYLAVGFDRLEDAREALQAAGLPFDEVPPDGCAGPVYAVLRFSPDLDQDEITAALESAGIG